MLYYIILYFIIFYYIILYYIILYYIILYYINVKYFSLSFSFSLLPFVLHVLGRPAEFTVYTHKAGGAGNVEVVCKDADGNPVEVKMKDNRDGTYSVSYMPIKPGTYTVTIKFASANIPKSPYEVIITSVLSDDAAQESFTSKHGQG